MSSLRFPTASQPLDEEECWVIERQHSDGMWWGTNGSGWSIPDTLDKATGIVVEYLRMGVRKPEHYRIRNTKTGEIISGVILEL